MKVLICAQAVDLDDPVLGFFHRWIEEFARHCEHVTIICLNKGRHALPGNVRVCSLGKEHASGPRLIKRIRYSLRFYGYVWRLRREYDAVFVHMNQEYVLLGGPFWRLFRKRIVLWRNHIEGSFLTRIAVLLSDVVCYTSSKAYVARFSNARQMPVGIDMSVYATPRTAETGTLLFLSRIDPVKRLDILLDALEILHAESMQIRLHVYGEPTPSREEYLATLRSAHASLEDAGVVSYHGSVKHEDTPGIYATHDIFVNTTASGSFDKTIIEAMSSGCLVVAANDAVRDVIEDLWWDGKDATGLAASIRESLRVSLAGDTREAVVQRQRTYVKEEHSLTLLVSRLFTLFRAA